MSILHLASPWTAWPCVTIVAGCSQGHHRPGTGVRMAWRAANASWRCSGTSQACWETLRSPSRWALPSTPSKPHLKGIHCKLAAAHCGEAVRRARLLGLIW